MTRFFLSKRLFHITDWLPTLMSAIEGWKNNTSLQSEARLCNLIPKSAIFADNNLVGSKIQDLDGVDQWRELSGNLPAKRREMLYNINPRATRMRSKNAGIR